MSGLHLHSNPLRPKILGQYPRHLLNRALGAGVEEVVWRNRATSTQTRTQQHNMSALLHVRQCLLHQEIRPLDVQIVCQIEILFCRLLDCVHNRSRGVWDQDVDFAIGAPCSGFFDEALEILDVSGVSADRDGFVRANFLNECISGSGVGGVVDYDAGAEGGEQERGRGADAFGCAGDQSGFVGEGKFGCHFVSGCVCSRDFSRRRCGDAICES